MMNSDLVAANASNNAVVNVESPNSDKKRAPPTSIQCLACTHWKHPRASKCKEEGCACDCGSHQRGVKKKRQRAAIEAADGEWHSATHRRVIHQAKFAADCMQKSKAVYAVWVAYQNHATGAVHTDMWGSAPWVEKELGGKVGIVDIIWKAKAAQHLTTAAATVDGLGEYEPVMAALGKYGLEHLRGVFRDNKIDAVAFRHITENMLANMGVEQLGDRIKLLNAAREVGEEMAAAEGRARGEGAPRTLALAHGGSRGGGGGGGGGGVGNAGGSLDSGVGGLGGMVRLYKFANPVDP
jgi:hypothetical protein